MMKGWGTTGFVVVFTWELEDVAILKGRVFCKCFNPLNSGRGGGAGEHKFKPCLEGGEESQ